MTDLIVAKSIVVLASALTATLTGIAGVVAVLDPSIQNIAVAFIGAVVTITTVVFAFKTAALNRKAVELDAKIKDVEKQSNGMKDALLLAGARASRAEGQIEGRKDQKLEDLYVKQVPATGGEAANTAKVAEIIAVVDTNVREVDKKVESIDENVKEVHETVVKQTEIKTKT